MPEDLPTSKYNNSDISKKFNSFPIQQNLAKN